MDKRDQIEVNEKSEPVGANFERSLADVATEVGVQLMVLRQVRGICIEEVAARLKVSPLKLRCLESGEWDTLPEISFLQGVVRGYARIVGANPMELIEPLRPFRHSNAFMPPPALDDSSIYTTIPFRSSAFSSAVKWLWMLVVIGGIVAGVIGYFIRHDNHKLIELDSQRVMANSDLITYPDLLHEMITAASGFVSSMSVASLPVRMVEPIELPSDVTLNNGAMNRGNLILSLKADSWVEVRQSDGSVLLSQLLSGGDVQDITGDVPLKVVIGNVYGVEHAQFNGQPLELKANNVGNVVRLTLQ
ncbi:helix-turn-helix domain-containing protein [Candidatus Pandoraea novymonadis]|nr:helix-turn-helix domain-containing protein [Candidatus Pandoraea novymonadis]